DVLAAERDVIVFDNAGVGFSSGTTPDTFAAMARDAISFVEALGLTQIDALGWSIGGFVAQSVALERPALVRRLLVLASGPGGQNGAPGPEEPVFRVMTKESNDDEDFLYLFFGLHPEGRQLGTESLRRLDTRLKVSGAEVTPASYGAQLQAIAAWGSDAGSAWPRLAEIQVPVLV